MNMIENYKHGAPPEHGTQRLTFAGVTLMSVQ